MTERVSVYLSGASKEVSRVRQWASHLVRTGLFRFVDPWWSADVERWSGRDCYQTREEQARVAAQHQRAICESEILWLLAPNAYSLGALVEWGYGLALVDLLGDKAPVLCVSGHQSNASVFYGGCVYRDPSDALAFDFCCRIAREKLAARAVEVSP